MTTCSSTEVLTRGATAKFTTTFYDPDGAVVQPDEANVRIVYSTSANAAAVTTVAMTPPVTGDAWTALWDTRGALARQVYWSIRTGGLAPVSVEDGMFSLSANPANLEDFP